MYSIWWHIGKQRYIDRILLLIGIGVFAAFDILRFARILYQNFTTKQAWVRASAVERNGVILLRLELPRRWKIQPGDFVYLRCLSISPWSLFESHPFSIAWWEEDKNLSGQATTIYLLINPQHGFTSRLLHRSNQNRPLQMAIDGPFGKVVKTSNYGTIVLFATGIGIAALIPFIKAIMDDQKAGRTSVRRMSLIWEIDRES
jgi:predicted ferric reductase